jgi:uncharacterized protein
MTAIDYSEQMRRGGQPMARIRITAGDVSALATLDDSQTAQAIYRALPIEARVSTWGDEIYFGIPVHLEEDEAQAVVAMGDLGYWPPGHAFCIFFGRTPMSRGSEIRPASPVNVFGKVEGDARIFAQVPAGAPIRLEAEDGTAPGSTDVRPPAHTQ